MTGLDVAAHGITGNTVRDFVGWRPQTIPAYFRAHDYQTALIGKGHLPLEMMQDAFEHRRYCDLADADSFEPRTCHYFHHLVKSGYGDLYDQGKLPAGAPGSNFEGFVSRLPYSHSLERWTGDESLKFLRERDRSRPFFLKVSFQRPHEPYSPSADQSDWYTPDQVSLPDNTADYLVNRLAGKTPYQREYAQRKPGAGYPYRPTDTADLRRQMTYYYSLISAIDREIGRVRHWLKAEGDWENTVVVYLSDHGDFAGEHGLMLKNLGAYESIHRVPFVLRIPGQSGNQVEESLVDARDLFPTLCAAAGLEVPKSLPGRNLLGAYGPLEETTCEWDFSYSSGVALRTPTHRLVYYREAPNDGELYDLRRDPGELDNLFHQAAAREMRDRLLAQLGDRRNAAPRRFGVPDDQRVNAELVGTPTKLLHKEARSWSSVAPMVPAQFEPRGDE